MKFPSFLLLLCLIKIFNADSMKQISSKSNTVASRTTLFTPHNCSARPPTNGKLINCSKTYPKSGSSCRLDCVTAGFTSCPDEVTPRVEKLSPPPLRANISVTPLKLIIMENTPDISSGAFSLKITPWFTNIQTQMWIL